MLLETLFNRLRLVIRTRATTSTDQDCDIFSHLNIHEILKKPPIYIIQVYSTEMIMEN